MYVFIFKGIKFSFVKNKKKKKLKIKLFKSENFFKKKYSQNF